MNTDRMSAEIGRRAAAEVRNRARTEDTSYSAQLELIDIPSSTFWRWDHGYGAPGADGLRRMYLRGYDVIYILTGKRSGEKEA